MIAKLKKMHTNLVAEFGRICRFYLQNLPLFLAEFAIFFPCRIRWGHICKGQTTIMMSSSDWLTWWYLHHQWSKKHSFHNSPKIHEQLIPHHHGNISSQRIYNQLHDANIKAARYPLLTALRKAARLNWCQNHQNRSATQSFLRWKPL